MSLYLDATSAMLLCDASVDVAICNGVYSYIVDAIDAYNVVGARNVC